MRYILLVLLLCGFGFSVQAAPAKKLFSIAATSTGQSAQVNFNNVEEASLIFGNLSLRQLLPGYNDGTGPGGIQSASAVDFLLDFRGLGMQLNYAQGSSRLQLLVPELGINQSFDGGNRKASADQFYDWLKHNPQGDVDRIMTRLAAVSEVDTLAGNPASLMNQMIDDVSDAALFVDNRLPGTEQENAGDNQVGIGIDYTRYQTDRGDINKVKMPLSYTTRFDHKPGMQLDLRLPVSYQEVDGAKSYSLPFSAVLRYPLTDVWTLTPAVGYGIAASEDLGSGGTMYSALLTSSYVFVFDSFQLTMGNMAGKLKTQEANFGDYSFEPQLSNNVLRNGLLFSKAVNWLGDHSFIEVFWVNTQMSGSDLLVEDFNVVGMSFGPGRSKTGEANTYNFGFKYLFADDIKAYSLDVSYWF